MSIIKLKLCKYLVINRCCTFGISLSKTFEYNKPDAFRRIQEHYFDINITNVKSFEVFQHESKINQSSVKDAIKRILENKSDVGEERQATSHKGRV
jgi:hypothetical protein